MAISRFSKSGVGLGLPKQQSFNSYALPITSGLVGWFDASDPNSMSVSSGLVGQFNNKSVSGGSFVQATGSLKPTLTSYGTNGYQALRFDGVDDLMIWDSGVFNDMPKYSLFIASRWNSGSSTDYEPELSTTDTALTNNGAFHYVNAPDDKGASYPFNLGTVSYDTQDTLYTNGQKYLLEQYATGIGNPWYVLKNGVREGGTTVIGTLSNLTKVYLAAQPLSSRVGKFDIAEIIIYNNELVDIDKKRVRNYLNEKWGIY